MPDPMAVETQIADPDYGDTFEIAPEDEDRPTEFKEPSAVQQCMLQGCDANMGHPMMRDFAHVLRHWRVRTGVVERAKRRFHCDACGRMERPCSRRPASLMQTFRFNHICGTGTFSAAL